MGTRSNEISQSGFSSTGILQTPETNGHNFLKVNLQQEYLMGNYCKASKGSVSSLNKVI